MTARLYLSDDSLSAEATVTAVASDAVALDRSCFYPGGGGQPADSGTLTPANGEALRVTTVRADADGVLWHELATAPPAGMVGRRVRLSVDAARSAALSRYHTALHVLNTIALRDYGAWITGAQIAVEYARIDFKWEGFAPALAAELEVKVNDVLAAGHALRAYYIDEVQFIARGDLRRTLDVQPPIVDGRVRVVEISGFDAQACGGTHVHSLAELGRASIYRTENKGKINKRLYVKLH